MKLARTCCIPCDHVPVRSWALFKRPRSDARAGGIVSSRSTPNDYRMSQVHARARTTPLIRAEIQASTLSLAELAEQYNVSRATIAKRQGRDGIQDRSHRPHKLATTLSQG